MAFHFYANQIYNGDGSIRNVCHFSEENEPSPDWALQNSGSLDWSSISQTMYLKNDKDKEIRQLSPVERLLRVSSIQETDLPLIGSEDHDQIVEEHLSVQESVCKFVEPSKTLAIAFRHRFQKNVRHALAFTYSAITILSSARTVELYSSGDYVGTFRGDPLPGNPDSLASSTFNNRMKPQLFRIKVNEDYPRKCRDLLFKFFVPKSQGSSLNLHWLVIQGKLLQQDESSAVAASTASTADSLPTPSSETTMAATSGLVSNVFPPLPFLLENSRVSLVSRNDHNASGIDLEKVKALMGQMQIDSLPQGAKDLMRVMEHHQLSSTIQNQGHLTSTAITSGPASQPLSISAHDISSSDTMPSEPATNKTAKEQIVYATKADLAQMEARIMTTIDHRLQELEDRILSKLLNAKQR